MGTWLKTLVGGAVAIPLFAGVGMAPAYAAPDDERPDGRVDVLELGVIIEDDASIGKAARMGAERCGTTVGEQARKASYTDRTGESQLSCPERGAPFYMQDGTEFE